MLMATVAAAAAPLSAAQNTCAKPIPLDPAPAWVNSALWLPSPGAPSSGGKILAVDSIVNKVWLYDTAGKGVLQSDKSVPSLLTTSQGRILLQLVSQDVVSLDSGILDSLQTKAVQLDDLPPHSILKNVRTKLGPLAVTYQLLGIDDALLATGLVVDKQLQKGYQAGLFRFPVSDGEKTAEVVLTVDAWDYYVVGYQYLTSIVWGTAYFLDLDQGTARLFEIPPGRAARELKGAVPPEVRAVPPFSAIMNGPQDGPTVFSNLARLRLATGIYGGPDGNVYLLAREPEANGTNDWWMFRISPKGEVLGKALLPTHAQHLSVVVSPDTFYLFERGAVNRFGGQDIRTLIAVPATTLERAPPQGVEVCSR